MKRSVGSAVLILLAVLGGAAAARAVPRTMLLETFTNTSCGPCAINNPIVRDFLTAYGPALALGIQYHVNWPSATDPFYLLTAAEVNARRSYYSVTGVPANFADGGSAANADYAALESSAADRLLTDAPFTLAVQQSIAGGQVNVTVTVTAAASLPAGTKVLRVALIETEVHYATPPGTNGETDFYNSMRRMMPDANGTTLTINPGEQKVYNLSAPVDAAWNTANIRSLAWIQLEATKEVLQAGSSMAKPAYAFYFGGRSYVDIGALGTMKSFKSMIINEGSNSDTYGIHITQSMPAAWSGSICVGPTCYPPWTTDVTRTLSAGAQDSVLVDITPLTTGATGSVTLTVTSQGDPSKHWTRTYRLIAGVPVLCVDGDGGYGFEAWYTAALDSAVTLYATWSRAADGALSAAQLHAFSAVVWNADLAYPPLTAGDMTAIGTYLDAGGRLLISGQDIGWAMCDAGSPYMSLQTQSWFAQYLGADYVADDSGIHTVTGVAHDVCDGLSFAIEGGTGSGMQDYPDEIDPRAGASPILLYDSGREAAVRYRSGVFKTVYLAYGFQGQATAASRIQVMRRSLRWLDCPNVLDVSDRDAVDLASLAPRATPNPFGPSTTISFVAGGSAPAPASVAVYDVTGRCVRTLWDGPIQPGARTFSWDGRDEHGSLATSGVYLVRVRVGDQRRSLKLVLAR